MEKCTIQILHFEAPISKLGVFRFRLENKKIFINFDIIMIFVIPSIYMVIDWYRYETTYVWSKSYGFSHQITWRFGDRVVRLVY